MKLIYSQTGAEVKQGDKVSLRINSYYAEIEGFACKLGHNREACVMVRECGQVKTLYVEPRMIGATWA